VSWSRNGAASGFVVCAYSPGRRRKKKPNKSMSAMAWPRDVPDVGELCRVSNYGERDWLDPGWWWVFLFVGAELA